MSPGFPVYILVVFCPVQLNRLKKKDFKSPLVAYRIWATRFLRIQNDIAMHYIMLTYN